MNDALIQLIYVSTASDELGERDLREILDTARRVNAEREITGMLLFGDGNFMQVLEGRALEVREVYADIGRDPRHRDVTLIIDEPLETRHFPAWAMAFRSLEKGTFDGVPGYSDFMLDGGRACFCAQPNMAGELLRTFRRNTLGTSF